LPNKIVQKLAKKYHLSTEYLLTGEGNMFNNNGHIPEQATSDANEDSISPRKPTGEEIRMRKALGEDDDEGLIVVPIKAQAGYSQYFLNPVFINQLKRMQLPLLPYRGDKYRIFQVQGDSMDDGTPEAIKENQFVIAEKVDPQYWEFIPNFYVYVIVKENQILIKRLYLKEDKETFVLISDNTFHPQELIHKKDIKEIWAEKMTFDYSTHAPKQSKINI
jgi:phage repressor protein C with HTH and peptisase S24 domain